LPNVGRIVAVSGPLVTAAFDEPVMLSEVGYAVLGDVALKAELIRVRGDTADLQVFEDTTGLFVGGRVEFSGEMLSAELGPGLLGLVVDGLQNPLEELAEASGYFLARGRHFPALDRERRWAFTPRVQAGDSVRAGDTLGTVPEGVFVHRVMVPFALAGVLTVTEVAGSGTYTVADVVATLEDERGRAHPVTMLQRWPVKRPIQAYRERLRPETPLTTKVRVIDSLFPVARGGTACVPGPFGAGKTVLQQLMSRHAEVDVVVVAACGERAGEVVETLREFPELTDPRTGRSLMERTVIVCNTSSMPVAAREASVYTAVTIAGVLPPDGPGRAAGGRLDQPLGAGAARGLREARGDPRRGGVPRLPRVGDRRVLRAWRCRHVARWKQRLGDHHRHREPRRRQPRGARHAGHAEGDGCVPRLSGERADARRYPAIDPLESWSHYAGVVDAADAAFARTLLRDGHEIAEMMKVVGEEGTAWTTSSGTCRPSTSTRATCSKTPSTRSTPPATPSARRTCSARSRSSCAPRCGSTRRTPPGASSSASPRPPRSGTAPPRTAPSTRHAARACASSSTRCGSMHEAVTRLERIAGNVVAVRRSMPRTASWRRSTGRAAPPWRR
jgi:V/A-type H+/Na+-transporting ATPase subunit A